MDACNSCTETQKVPTCTKSLVLGAVEASKDYVVYVKNNATGYIHKQFSTSAPDGLLSLDMELPFPDFYSPNFYFTIWATEEDADTYEYAPLVIEEEAVECVTTQFETIYDADGTVILDEYALKI